MRRQRSFAPGLRSTLRPTRRTGSESNVSWRFLPSGLGLQPPASPAASMACAIRRPRPRGFSCRLCVHRGLWVLIATLSGVSYLQPPVSSLPPHSPLPWPHRRCPPWHPAASWRRRPWRRWVFCCRCQTDTYPNGRSTSNRVPPLDTASTFPPRPPSGAGTPSHSSRRAATLRRCVHTSPRHSLTTNVRLPSPFSVLLLNTQQVSRSRSTRCA